MISFYDAGCTNASVPPFVEIRLARRVFPTLLELTTCLQQMRQDGANSSPPLAPFLALLLRSLQIPRFWRNIQESCRKVHDSLGCAAAIDFCYQPTGPLVESGKL